MAEEPKLCPFCGGKPVRIKKALDERYAYADSVRYECPTCGVRRGAIGDMSKPGYADNSTVEERALAAWNQRACPPLEWAEDNDDGR